MVGAVNGQIVIQTILPSFIVTLAFLFILRGLTLVGLKFATGGSTQLRGIDDVVHEGVVKSLFSGVALQGFFSWLASNNLIDKFDNGLPKVSGVPVSILWFIGFALIATWVLLRTRVGTGSTPPAEIRTQPAIPAFPSSRVKTGLFMLTATAAGLVAILRFSTPARPTRAVASKRNSRRSSRR